MIPFDDFILHSLPFFHSLIIGTVADDIICNCWDAICNNHVHDENGFLVLSSPDGTAVPWGVQYSYTQKLLVREEYQRVFNNIMNRMPLLKSASLSGTKGIGKTIFLFWLIYKLVSSRASGSPIPSFLLVVGKSKTQYLLHYRNGKAEVTSWTGGPQRVDYVLSDVSYNLDVTPVHWSLLVSSYGATEPREYIDALGNLREGGLQMVMGTANYQEIMKLAPNERVGEFSYLIFGGSIRMLCFMLSDFQGAKVISHTQREEVKEIMLEFLADSKYVDGSYDDLIEKSCDVICSRMDVDNSTPEAIKHSLFKHSRVEIDEKKNVNIVPTVASTFMGYYASFLLEQHTADALSGLRLMLTNAGIGNLFERHVLKTVVEKYKTGAQFKVKRMHPSGYNRAVNDEDEIQLNVPISRKVFIRTIDDIALLKDGELGIPCVGNFPVVDFVIKPFIEGQITVGKTHPCAYSRHRDLENAMGGKVTDRQYILFCDNSNYDGLRYDSKLLPQVKQYKMLVAWTAERKRPDDLRGG